jgi:hypothetical protein
MMEKKPFILCDISIILLLIFMDKDVLIKVASFCEADVFANLMKANPLLIKPAKDYGYIHEMDGYSDVSCARIHLKLNSTDINLFLRLIRKFKSIFPLNGILYNDLPMTDVKVGCNYHMDVHHVIRRLKQGTMRTPIAVMDIQLIRDYMSFTIYSNEFDTFFQGLRWIFQQKWIDNKLAGPVNVCFICSNTQEETIKNIIIKFSKISILITTSYLCYHRAELVSLLTQLGSNWRLLQK